ncbi:MAG: anaerobic glycerol-3-phosphate dehydrogenase subunit A [Anaerolineae bacterium]|nr:anaerobic glycerol-3-phosphate dehydrogenase subunit A [Anaerolineae bacterium]
MRHVQTEVVVIGGGSTGTGCVRDLAMRGFKTMLVEKRDLTHGTTGRYHGLLHSGGRYVVKDPVSAKECIEENFILRRIMPQALEDTGGFFVQTPGDDPSYGPKFKAACDQIGVPCQEVPIVEMLRREPRLNPKISLCYAVPDGSADSFLATRMVAESARQYGAQVLTYHEVVALLRDGDRVTGVHVRDVARDEEFVIDCDFVVNASGAWAGQIAHLAGVDVNVIPGKGVMVAMNHRLVNTVVNRLKMPSDGDIIVPIHTVCVMGTTDHKVVDPENLAIEPWEVDLMLQEGEKLVPGFKQARALRAWAGVRPLYQDKAAGSDTRDVTRTYTLIDHESRDGVQGFLTITGGKWTTFRQMAEKTIDAVCEKLAVTRPCRTALEPVLPGSDAKFHWLGAPLNKVEEQDTYGRLACECELVTIDRVRDTIASGFVVLDDIRRDLRLGMGPCQGGFCTYRAAGLLQQMEMPPVQQTNLALRDFLQERWKGLRPVLWGDQARQERLDELIYCGIMNVEHLPPDGLKSPMSDFYVVEDVKDAVFKGHV